MSYFGISTSSLMKFTLIIWRNPGIKMSTREVAKLELNEEEVQFIRKVCKGVFPKVYANFKLALHGHILVERFIENNEVLETSGLSRTDREKRIIISARRKKAYAELPKKNCKWFELCSKVVLAEKLAHFSCVDCPQLFSEDLVTFDVWLAKPENLSQVYGKTYY